MEVFGNKLTAISFANHSELLYNTVKQKMII